MDPKLQIVVLESQVENLIGANTHLHDLIAQQIKTIHDLELKVLKYEQPSAKDH